MQSWRLMASLLHDVPKARLSLICPASFSVAASDGPCFSEAGDVSTEAEARHMRRRRHAVITRRLVPLSGQESGPVDVGSHERSRVMLEQAFDAGIIEIK